MHLRIRACVFMKIMLFYQKDKMGKPYGTVLRPEADQLQKGCELMLYPADVKRELEAILEIFEEYMQGQNYFDIIYSEKFGYIWIAVPSPGVFDVRKLNTAEKMLESFFHDMIDDVIFSPENPVQEHNSFELTEYEARESRCQIAAILKTVNNPEDRMRYLDLMDGYIKAYPKKFKVVWEWEE